MVLILGLVECFGEAKCSDFLINGFGSESFK
jgi:hypothetical protein